MKHVNTIVNTLCVLMVAAAFYSCADEKANSSGQRRNTTLSVEAIKLYPQPLDNKIVATGTITANEEVELKSEVSGKVVGIHFQEGSTVKKGQVLVKLDDRDLRAQLKKFKVEEEFSRQDSSRQARLMEVSATTQEVYDAALNRLRTAQAEIDLIRVQIEKTEIKAPFNGVIGLRQISVGSYLTPAVIISVIQEIDPIKLDFKVPEKYVGQVTRGMNVTFSITSSSKEFVATIYAVEPKIDFNTRTVTARARSSNPGLYLLPGGFAEIELILEKMDDALIVPSQAVIPDLNGQVVFLYKNGKVNRVPVNIGVRTERSIQLLDGVNPGDTVITTGLLQVRHDMSVNVKKLVNNG